MRGQRHDIRLGEIGVLVCDRLEADDRVLKPETQRGVNAHHNLSLCVANSPVAVDAGGQEDMIVDVTLDLPVKRRGAKV